MASKVREVYLPADHDDERKSALWLMAFKFAAAVNLIVCISLLPQALSQRSQRLSQQQGDSSTSDRNHVSNETSLTSTQPRRGFS